MKNNYYEELATDEKILYLEGKIEMLQRNHEGMLREYAKEKEALMKKNGLLSVHLEEMKENVSSLKREVKFSEVERDSEKKERRKRQHREEPSSLSFILPDSVGDSSLMGDTLSNTLPDKTINEELLNREGNREENEADENISLEWVLDRIQEPVEFNLSELSSQRLKVFGRFFKKEFDSIYSSEEVLRALGRARGDTREFVKSLLYLSDRRDIICGLLPYLFKKHIISNGSAYIKEIVKILSRHGTGMFLGDSDVISEIKCFFEECRDSLDLLLFVEDTCSKAPRSIAPLLSSKYLMHISRTHPMHAFRIVESLEASGADVCIEDSREIIHSSEKFLLKLPYKEIKEKTRSSNHLSFYF
ncbi:hypothetical protein NEFER03_0183 [Nematocida sp. LUAm3]|nr:hypothetical protein NEFER03_0183 [Nematocida sp. LUAm3]KAI5173636.1 hypothetical protein NEFER02_0152 [Nematocida sp. LUAm2]KAI5176857.1 hypothetical protein NEFER01_0182 [Nematocida sp. LUAm1]